MVNIDFYRGKSENLKNIEVQEGYFYLTSDTGKLYTGLENKLCYIGDIITVKCLTDLPPKSEYFYYIEEDNSFWKYNEKWIQINNSSSFGLSPKTELSKDGIILKLNDEIQVLIPNSYLGIKAIISNSLNIKEKENNTVSIELQWHEF